MSASNSPDHSASSAANNLYCHENAGEVVHSDRDKWISGDRHCPPCDENTINSLLDSEHLFFPFSDYLPRIRQSSVDVAARQDSINWILKVRAYYRFSPVTALLSVNYLDRFLSSHSLPGNGWSLQLLSVTCLFLAAKMEEIHVPLLLDLQILELEPGFVFEPKTVQRMELRVLSTLNWRLRSVTPFDYLHYFISKSRPDNFIRVFNASSDLILNNIRVIDFLGFPPSTIAAAAVVCSTGAGEVTVTADGELFHVRINKEMVRSCHQLMQDYLVDTCPSSQLNKETTAEPPSSPAGVLDAAACRSCDTRSENPCSVSQPEAEPSAKRPRSSTPDVQQP